MARLSSVALILGIRPVSYVCRMERLKFWEDNTNTRPIITYLQWLWIMLIKHSNDNKLTIFYLGGYYCEKSGEHTNRNVENYHVAKSVASVNPDDMMDCTALQGEYPGCFLHRHHHHHHLLKIKKATLKSIIDWFSSKTGDVGAFQMNNSNILLWIKSINFKITIMDEQEDQGLTIGMWLNWMSFDMFSGGK
ncbi:hypothetical protein ACJX0J_010282 [Zea mays]